jgi:hypothetical protein
MGLTDSDMKSGDIYKTKYITWNNMGLEKEDADLYAYQLLASVTDSVGIHEGTIFNYHQTQMAKNSETYLDGLENLQYDILYGDRYCYDGEDLYPATDIVMGIDEVVVDEIEEPSMDFLSRLVSTDDTESEEDEADEPDDADNDEIDEELKQQQLAEKYEGQLLIRGNNFTRWSRVFINGQKVSTTYISSGTLMFDGSKLEDGDTVCVSQLGSNSTVFRSSNEYIYSAPEEIENTEDTEASDADLTETQK